MDPLHDFGRINPNAPPELARFAFLIGNWRCEAKAKSNDGTWQAFTATWVGRFTLDGYAIADEFRLMDAAGKLIVLGVNFRTYDAATRTWQLKWLNAFAGTWTDLGPPELGGVRFDGRSVVYAFKEPVAGHGYTRATYTSVAEDHFTWRGEQSSDLASWREFMVLDAYRNRAAFIAR